MISNDHSHNSMINNKNTMAHSSTPQQPQDHPHQQQQQQQSLKCPRCDSANTKFCYYNNYSLSQPRHFCKACKRYWTRGGTLRNVPVGGGCRKNKRLKRPSSSSSSAAATSSSGIVPSLINSGDSHIDQLTGSNPSHVGSSLFYGSNHEISLPFSSSRYEQPHHLSSALGLGFSSNNGDGGYQSSLLSSYGSIFGGSSSPTIASLLASKFSNGTGFQALAPFEELNIAGINGGHGDRYNNNNNNNKQGVKVESGGQGRSSSSALGWINGVGVGGGNNSATNNQADQIGLSSDPSLYWPANPTAVGGGNWLDPMASLGSNNSVPSLI